MSGPRFAPAILQGLLGYGNEDLAQETLSVQPDACAQTPLNCGVTTIQGSQQSGQASRLRPANNLDAVELAESLKRVRNSRIVDEHAVVDDAVLDHLLLPVHRVGDLHPAV